MYENVTLTGYYPPDESEEQDNEDIDDDNLDVRGKKLRTLQVCFNLFFSVWH